MVNKEKQAHRRIMAFKKQHFNSLVNKCFTFKSRNEEGIAYEDIYCRGVLIARFIYDGKMLRFEEVQPEYTPLVDEYKNNLEENKE